MTQELTDAQVIGRRVAERRRGRFLTQAQLAAAAGAAGAQLGIVSTRGNALERVAMSTVSRLENGERLPRFSTLRLIATALEVDVAELVRGTQLDPGRAASAE